MVISPFGTRAPRFRGARSAILLGFKPRHRFVDVDLAALKALEDRQPALGCWFSQVGLPGAVSDGRNRLGVL